MRTLLFAAALATATFAFVTGDVTSVSAMLQKEKLTLLIFEQKVDSNVNCREVTHADLKCSN